MTASTKNYTLPASLHESLLLATDGQVERSVELSRISRWGIGGLAGARVRVGNVAQAVEVLEIMHNSHEPFMTVGSTANLLFDSEGFHGVIIQLAGDLNNVKIDGHMIQAGGAATVRDVVEQAVEAGLSGIEHAVGVPGTIAGLVVMNGGTQRQSIGSNVASVEVIDPKQGFHKVPKADANFAYRKSAFQTNGAVVVGVQLSLVPGERSALKEIVENNLKERSKFPESQANCGSTFLSDPAFYDEFGPPGRIIEEAGYKGYLVGGAQVSQQHANFINNIGNATSDDVLKIIWDIRNTVFRQTGHLMNCEVRHVSPNGVITPAHIAAITRWGKPRDRGVR